MVFDPLFWLGLSFLLVSISLTAVLLVLLPTARELSRAARSIEKLCDTLSRELPPTLESIRLTSLEITELTDDVTEGVQKASRVAQRVDRSVGNVQQQAKRVGVGTRSLIVGVQAAWKSLTRSHARDLRRLPTGPVPPMNPLQAKPESLLSSNVHRRGHFSQQTGIALVKEPNHPPAELPSGKTPDVNLTSSPAESLINSENPGSSD